MKKLFTLLAVICCLTGLKAQYVTIHDANFVNWLQANVPSAMNGNQMDTTSPAVTLRTRIDVENLGITDLTGAQYFDSLKTLDCGNGQLSSNPNTLTSLPRLPFTLDTLVCGRNSLTSLPALPTTLKALRCYHNLITNLPALPTGLTILDCASNILSNLPTLPNTLISLTCNLNSLVTLPTLPTSLTSLQCSNNHLTSLPALPTLLTSLDCSVNNLSILPVIPSTLIDLICSYNQLTNISFLPNSLQSISCEFNNLNGLPVLPASLGMLTCQHNQIVSLPVLPTGLGVLICSENQLTSLPTLPMDMAFLDCSWNNITCFDSFNNSFSIYDPNGMNSFNISNNPFICLPNYIPAMDPTTLAYPLCAPGNANNCPYAEGIFGFIYKDNNNNCSKNLSDTDLKNIPLKIHDNSNNLLSQTYSTLNGVYSFTQTSNTYNVVVDTVGMPFVAQCSPGIDSTLTVALLDTNINFAFTCKPGFDIGVRSAITNGWVFPGQQHSLNINAGDMSHWYNLSCASGVSGQVQITVTGNVVYNGPAAGALAPTVSGNVFTYTIPDFGVINNTTDFNLLFTTNTNAQTGDAICVDINVTPTTGDNFISNNTAYFCYYVVNSHDPNKKETYPVDVPPGYIDYFTYTIHFQNTGSAPAFNINLLDTLDANLDLSTFQVTNYSHPNTAQLKGNILSFSFSNIQLPDSASDLAGSQGFVQYRIKPKSSWAAPYRIKNTAYIYFDFNAPVITNTTYNSIMTVTGLKAQQLADNISVYPNPTNGEFVIDSHSAENLEIRIMDISGNSVLETFSKIDKQTINVNHLAAGIYTLSLKSEAGISTIKLVVVK